MKYLRSAREAQGVFFVRFVSLLFIPEHLMFCIIFELIMKLSDTSKHLILIDS